MRQVVILAGGAGTRLQKRLNGLPKPMVEIAGKPLLEHQIELVKSCNFTDVVLLVSHGASAIRDYFGDGRNRGLSIRYVEDLQPRGTAGAMLDAFDTLANSVVVMYGDTLLDVDLARMYSTHQQDPVDATLFLHPNDHPHDSDLVEVDGAGRVVNFHPYPHDSNRYYPNLVNAALYVVRKESLAPYRSLPGIVDFGKHLFPLMLSDGATLAGYRSPEYIKDAGTPARLDRVEEDIRSGVVAMRSLARPAPAVFLDRDGTLNEEVNRVSAATELELIHGVAGPIRRLNRSQYRTAVITNQPVIARGDCTESELQDIHNKLETLLGRDGAYVDRIYYCPHHPDRGFVGERKDLKIKCSCRKPEPGLVLKAADDMNIDLAQSWFIGDTTTDIMTARAAGARSVIVRTGHAGLDARFPVRADFEFFGLEAAIDYILDDFPPQLARAHIIAGEFASAERVIVAGLARVGKSTWASLLKIALQGLGRRCVVISLDNWLRSADRRPAGGVLERYDVPAIENFVTELATVSATRTFDLPYYDRLRRRQEQRGERVRIDADDIVIFDGVIGLMIPALTEYATRRLYVEGSEARRRQDFCAEYAVRGLAKAEIEQLYRDREAEETPAVAATKALADLVIERLRP